MPSREITPAKERERWGELEREVLQNL